MTLVRLRLVSFIALASLPAFACNGSSDSPTVPPVRPATPILSVDDDVIYFDGEDGVRGQLQRYQDHLEGLTDSLARTSPTEFKQRARLRWYIRNTSNYINLLRRTLNTTGPNGLKLAADPMVFKFWWTSFLEVGTNEISWSTFHEMDSCCAYLWQDGYATVDGAFWGTTAHPRKLTDRIGTDMKMEGVSCYGKTFKIEGSTSHYAEQQITGWTRSIQSSDVQECGSDQTSSCEVDQPDLFQTVGTCEGTAGGDGPQYWDGDYTGGERVDFGTGKGTGKASICGSAAQVEYVCLDLYNEDGSYREFACGYATTC